jgi:translation elongation factor EF-G
MIPLGMSIQTETILRQAVIECVKPVIFLDNMEGALLELQMGQEDLYQTLHRVLENYDTVIATYADVGGPMGPLGVRDRRERGRESKCLQMFLSDSSNQCIQHVSHTSRYQLCKLAFLLHRLTPPRVQWSLDLVSKAGPSPSSSLPRFMPINSR